MRLPTLLVLPLLAAALLPSAAAARAPETCAALKGRDLAPGAGQRAVLRDRTLHFCVRGGTVRRLGGAPQVRGADGALLLVHRARTAEALDVATGRRATLGPVEEIAAAKVVARAGVAAVRRTSAGDAVLIVAPGRPRLIVERAAGRVEDLTVDTGLTWTRADRSEHAVLPDRTRRCSDLRTRDEPPGHVRLTRRGSRFYGCLSRQPQAPVFAIGKEDGRGPLLESAAFDTGPGAFIMRSTRWWGPDRFAASTDIIDLATGRVEPVAASAGDTCCADRGEELREHVLLGDGRLVTILDSEFPDADSAPRVSAVTVTVPGVGVVELARTPAGAPRAEALRVEGGVVRWTEAGVERSAPLP